MYLRCNMIESAVCMGGAVSCARAERVGGGGCRVKGEVVGSGYPGLCIRWSVGPQPQDHGPYEAGSPPC